RINRSARTIALAMGAIVLSLGLFIGGLWLAGFFTFTGSDQSSKIVAAALALVGGLVAALVSIIGMVLKYSIDKSAEERLQVESQRVANLQWEAENRLKLEAGIRAVELFSTSSGKPAPAIQRTGALFALASLGQHALTLSLMEDLLNREDIELAAVEALLNQALTCGDESVQADAIMLFNRHAEKMVTVGEVFLPEAITHWAPSLSAYAQEWAVIGLARMVAARPLAKWEGESRYRVTSLIGALALGWEHEKDKRLKENAGAILDEMLSAFPDVCVLHSRKRTIDLSKVRDGVKGSVASDVLVIEMVDVLRRWREGSAPTVVAADAAVRTRPRRKVPLEKQA
ncbi:MAG TPA: hypothetical protein VM756_08645, partial [Burkholderiales bacterium]|nr:hypothetical protein [Burkholderiales bacterium]